MFNNDLEPFPAAAVCKLSDFSARTFFKVECLEAVSNWIRNGKRIKWQK